MAELMEYVRTLADQIGPRPVSTEEEHQASLYIAQELTDCGYDVDVDEFATPTGTRWPYVIAFLSIIAGTLISGIGIFVSSIALSMLVVGIVLVVFGVFVYYMEYSNKRLFSKMRAGGVSQNVVARYVPSSVAREARRRKVVIVAHVDTVRAQPEAMPALVQKSAILRKIVYFDVFAMLLLVIVRVLPLPWPSVVDTVLWGVSLAGCLYLLIASLCIIANRFMAYISGGNDNASSIAVLLGTAKRLLDPEERERYAVEAPVEQDADNPVEMLVNPGTGSFAPVPVPDEVLEKPQPQIHDEQAARDADVVPEGATVEYVAQPVPEPALAESADDIPALSPEAKEALRDVTSAASDTEPDAVQQPDGGFEPDTADSSLPSWYRTAKKKAAEDMAHKEPDAQAQTASAPSARVSSADADADDAPRIYRSRFADMPLRGTLARSSTQVADEASAEMQPADEVPAETQPADEVPAEPVQASAVDQSLESELVPDVSDALKELLSVNLDDLEEDAASSIEFEISDDALDEFNPGLSGVFPALSETGKGDDAAQAASAVPDASAASFTSQTPEKGRGLFRGLTSRIPVIGAQGVVADVGSDDTDMAAQPDAEATTVIASGQPKRAERRRPTARRVSDDFQPTRVVDERDISGLEDMRQEAPISGVYEGTEQADPFAPHDEQSAQATPAIPRTPQVSPMQSGQFEPSPSSTSSFPSLTGSFPSLSGTMPAVSPDDFGESDSFSEYEPTADDVVDDYFAGAAGMTSEIDIPESRFHNAVDKVGGLFSRKGSKRRGADPDSVGDAEKWDDDDDFGWKGGAYLPESESAFAAARARAAEIRDSVVSMTESDLLDKEVWFVALGASSASGQGMRNLIDLHGSDLRGALIINLECVGAGDLHYIESEGTGTPHRSDRRLQSLARSASRGLSGTDMRSCKLHWRSTDATPAMEAGLRAMTIMGLDGAVPVAWHWRNDTSDIVDPDNLEYATKLLLKIIEES